MGGVQSEAIFEGAKSSTWSIVVCNIYVLRPHGNKTAKHSTKVAAKEEIFVWAKACATTNFAKATLQKANMLA